MDCFSVSALRTLVGECCYVAKARGEQHKGLTRAVLAGCLSPKAITTNRWGPRRLRIWKTDKNCTTFSFSSFRFKFSSVPDFYVPNKTQYKDYVEFIKNLPSKTDSELFDLDPKSQARNIVTYVVSLLIERKRLSLSQISADLSSARRFLLGFGRAAAIAEEAAEMPMLAAPEPAADVR